MAESKFDKLSIPEMLKKLDELYNRKEQIENQVKFLYQEYAQITEDIDLAQTIIMYQSNKLSRIRKGGIQNGKNTNRRS